MPQLNCTYDLYGYRRQPDGDCFQYHRLLLFSLTLVIGRRKKVALRVYSMAEYTQVHQHSQIENEYIQEPQNISQLDPWNLRPILSRTESLDHIQLSHSGVCIAEH
jgi:hypothetical protein